MNVTVLIILFNPGYNVTSYQYEPTGWYFSQKKSKLIGHFTIQQYYLVCVLKK